MKKLTTILLIALSLSSCKKWLDLQPETEVSRDELFQTEAGFQEALNGVYTRCVQGDLYGDELTFGYPEVLAQNYTLATGMDPMYYLQTGRYNYKDIDFITRKDKTWKGLYNGIVNANLILQEIDKKPDLFTGNNFALIKGEAMALRAFLHFDLFRLFGSYQQSTLAGIPYVTIYTNKVTAMSGADEVLTKVIADLEGAKALLRTSDSIVCPSYQVNYPNATDSSTETTSPSLFLQNRRHRLNYYAVCGELARVYLYRQDKVNALVNAEEVIQSNKFKWTSQADFIHVDVKMTDRILYKELVFGWPIKERANDVIRRFGQQTASFWIDLDAGQTLYEFRGVGAEDLRYKQWFQPTGGNRLELLKYYRNPNGKEDDATADRHPLMAPAIRLSEMYYIAAEASFEGNPSKALNYFNEVRRNRGIGTTLATDSYTEFMDELVKEARKEWYGEGQIFHMYKRLNRSIPAQTGGLIPASSAMYILPLPNDEIEFGGR